VQPNITAPIVYTRTNVIRNTAAGNTIVIHGDQFGEVAADITVALANSGNTTLIPIAL
jgi:hypothetical protein